ncbi:acyltransferase family protein [Gryllotalpicola protaetiae]|uniref:Acyltransferase n=1 Tax=Gryllotalpicola protaetiae TaxID=2419771 RepID=A0A387BEK4_9MICO|nr:acyltransferase [Gryllotalpicola protaetiae]AYG02333.1 acyltransferase [Gryllotalpicola protaetiae]
MATTPALPAPSADVDLSARDLSVDLARVFAVVVVVIVHMLMIGVGIHDGQIVVTQPLQRQPWYVPATLFGQVMPLFFALGGFATLTSYRRRDLTAAEFIRKRTLRMARPTLSVFVVFALAGWLAFLLGVDPELVNVVLAGVGTPLWFFAAYLLCQACAPLMVRLHRTHPLATFVVLAAGAVAIDTARRQSGHVSIGWLNFFFVWLFVQQIGFLYAERVFHRRRILTLGVFLAAASLLAVLVLNRIYNTDMLYNLNPPSVPLMLLGIAQLSLLVLLHPALEKLMRSRVAQLVVFAIGTRLMTVYVWHMTCLLLVTGVALLIPHGLPDPASGAWWKSRPLVLLATFALIFLISLWSVRFEKAPHIPDGFRGPGLPWALVAVVVAFIPMFAITDWGMDRWLALAGLIGLAATLVLLRPQRVAVGPPTRGRAG